MATWPATLQDKINSTQFEYGFGETRIKTDTDVGPAKLRSRFTDAVDIMSGQIHMTNAEVGFLKTFYKTTLNNGVTAFDWVDPFDGVTTISVRFVERPRIRPLGGLAFVATLNLEILP